jgi:DNA-binding NarL/FixJ family response regulator
MTDVIRIMVVDDHPVVRDGLIAMLSTQADFKVVAEASNGLEAVQKDAAFAPDIILLDLEMPHMDGVNTLRALRQQSARCRALVFTAYDTDERILSALKAGAQGYLLKGVPRDDLFHAIRVIYAGGSLLQPVVASKLLRQVSAAAEPVREEETSLTRRELEVLDLLAQGLRNIEIAERLTVTLRTVKFHISAILSKLGASNRTEAVKIAAHKGLIKLA